MAKQFTFGKYNGQTPAQVIANDLGYMKWVASESDILDWDSELADAFVEAVIESGLAGEFLQSANRHTQYIQTRRHVATMKVPSVYKMDGETRVDCENEERPAAQRVRGFYKIQAEDMGQDSVVYVQESNGTIQTAYVAQGEAFVRLLLTHPTFVRFVLETRPTPAI